MAYRNETARAGTGTNLPVPVTPAGPRPSLRRHALPAQFVAHLLAARHGLEGQRARRRAPAGHAALSYNAGREIAVKRLPAGYRTTRVV